jgi:nitrogen fixation/metabolism regulation signal transduction histidine kinase
MEQAAPAQASPGPAPTGRHKRHVRNFLLDSGFQLKYSGYLVATTLTLSVLLGSLLWTTSREVIAQSLHSVDLGQELVHHGERVLTESKKVKAVVEMNIVKDPVYADNPELIDAFRSDAREHDEALAQQQAQLEQNARALKDQALGLARQQREFGIALVIVLALLVVGIGLAGIVVTHRIAGPVFKMKRQLSDLAHGSFRIPAPLRKGDELVHFFDAFNDAVKTLRTRQEDHIAKLDAVITKLQSGQSGSDAAAALTDLRAQMHAPLER